MSAARAYIETVQSKLAQVATAQLSAITQAAAIIRQTLIHDGLIYLFGTGHSHMLAEEGHYRAGGVAAVCPILSTSLMLHEGAVASTQFERTRGVAAAVLVRYQPQPRDCMIVFSNSGVNAVPVEMALAAKSHGLQVIAVIAEAYANTLAPRIDSKKLGDVADVVIDNHGEAGDALIALNGGIKAGPLSTIVGAMILNAILLEAVSTLPDDVPPPVYISANMPNAQAHNEGLIQRYRARNPHL